MTHWIFGDCSAPAGTVVGQILSWTACRNGQPVLVAEEYWTVTSDIPGWDLELDGQFLVRALVEGMPRFQLDFRIANDRVEGLRKVSSGQVAVAMTGVRAIPYVLEAAPGVVVPEIFGAYRWPE